MLIKSLAYMSMLICEIFICMPLVEPFNSLEVLSGFILSLLADMQMLQPFY